MFFDPNKTTSVSIDACLGQPQGCIASEEEESVQVPLAYAARLMTDPTKNCLDRKKNQDLAYRDDDFKSKFMSHCIKLKPSSLTLYDDNLNGTCSWSQKGLKADQCFTYKPE